MSAREALLDAARAELEKSPWRDVTMAAIARRAGLSRQTLYNEFGSREMLAQAYVLRESDRFLAAVEAAVTAHRDDPPAALAAAFEVFLAAAAEDPLVRAITGGEGDELLPLVTTQGRPLLEHATDRLAALMQREWPALRPDDTRMLADAVVRLAISFAALPAGPAALTGRSVAALLGPFAERALR